MYAHTTAVTYDCPLVSNSDRTDKSDHYLKSVQSHGTQN